MFPHAVDVPPIISLMNTSMPLIIAEANMPSAVLVIGNPNAHQEPIGGRTNTKSMRMACSRLDNPFIYDSLSRDSYSESFRDVKYSHVRFERERIFLLGMWDAA